MRTSRRFSINPPPLTYRLSVNTGGLSGVTINDGVGNWAGTYKDYPVGVTVNITISKAGYTFNPNSFSQLMTQDRYVTTIGTPDQSSIGRQAYDDAMDALVDHRSTAYNDTRKADGNLAGDGDIIQSIDDRVGGHHVGYSGYTTTNPDGDVAPMLGRPELKVQYLLGFTDPIKFWFMKNQEGIQFDSAERYGMPIERIIGYVMISPDYHIFEAISNHMSRPYFGNLNGRNSSSTPRPKITFRLTNGETYKVDVNWSDRAINCAILHIKEDGLESESGRVSVRLWVNGELQNANIHLETFKRNPSTEGFGTDTNCEMMGMVEIFTKYGATTDIHIGNIFSVMTGYYGQLGVPFDVAYCNNLDVQKNGNNVSCTIGYNTDSTGAGIDTSKTRIEWEWGTSLQRMKRIDAVNNMTSFNRITAGVGSAFNGGVTRCNVYVTPIGGVEYKIPAVWFGQI